MRALARELVQEHGAARFLHRFSREFGNRSVVDRSLHVCLGVFLDLVDVRSVLGNSGVQVDFARRMVSAYQRQEMESVNPSYGLRIWAQALSVFKPLLEDPSQLVVEGLLQYFIPFLCSGVVQYARNAPAGDTHPCTEGVTYFTALAARFKDATDGGDGEAFAALRQRTRDGWYFALVAIRSTSAMYPFTPEPLMWLFRAWNALGLHLGYPEADDGYTETAVRARITAPGESGSTRRIAMIAY
ncbi:hypothetical protein OF83DRAFT_916193 [Amylostereum chailletii]|nr:hypothetical protein OF83DRAFT_916193 [Amylostereum chailletii]